MDKKACDSNSRSSSSKRMKVQEQETTDRDDPPTSSSSTVTSKKRKGKKGPINVDRNEAGTSTEEKEGILKVDPKAKLERSRQSARECRARKKLRYQYLEDLVAMRESKVLLIRENINHLVNVAQKIDDGALPLDQAVHLVHDPKKEPSSFND